jgi:hypothetical protein
MIGIFHLSLSRLDNWLCRIRVCYPRNDWNPPLQRSVETHRAFLAAFVCPLSPSFPPFGQWALSALLRRSLHQPLMTAVDPLLPFEIGRMNGRKAPESGLRPRLPNTGRSTRCDEQMKQPTLWAFAATRRGGQGMPNRASSNVGQVLRPTLQGFQPPELVLIPSDSNPRAFRADNGATGDL